MGSTVFVLVSVYWRFTGDLLVGWSSYVDDTDDDQLTFYNQTGQPTQTILHNDEIQNICRVCEYIIETIYRDTIVTDVDDLVVSSLFSKMSPSFSLWASYTKNTYGKLTRYDQTGQLTQTIIKYNGGLNIYIYIYMP